MNIHEREDAAERWLDEALKDYSKTVCRPGMENRILATLEARAAQRQRRGILALAAASAVVVIVAGLMSSLRPIKQNVPNQNLVLKPSPEAVPGAANAVAHPPEGGGTKPGRRVTIQVPRPRARRRSEQQVFEEGKSYLTPIQDLEPEPLIAQQGTSAQVSIQDLGVQPIEIKELAPIRDMN